MYVVERIWVKNAIIKNEAKKGEAQNGEQDSEFEFHG